MGVEFLQLVNGRSRTGRGITSSFASTAPGQWPTPASRRRGGLRAPAGGDGRCRACSAAARRRSVSRRAHRAPPRNLQRPQRSALRRRGRCARPRRRRQQCSAHAKARRGWRPGRTPASLGPGGPRCLRRGVSQSAARLRRGGRDRHEGDGASRRAECAGTLAAGHGGGRCSRRRWAGLVACCAPAPAAAQQHVSFRTPKAGARASQRACARRARASVGLRMAPGSRRCRRARCCCCAVGHQCRTEGQKVASNARRYAETTPGIGTARPAGRKAGASLPARAILPYVSSLQGLGACALGCMVSRCRGMVLPAEGVC